VEFDISIITCSLWLYIICFSTFNDKLEMVMAIEEVEFDMLVTTNQKLSYKFVAYGFILSSLFQIFYYKCQDSPLT
jgi:hypothetical protein